MCSLACLLARARARADASPLARLASARAKVCSLLAQAAFGIGVVGLWAWVVWVFRFSGISGFRASWIFRPLGFRVFRFWEK